MRSPGDLRTANGAQDSVAPVRKRESARDPRPGFDLLASKLLRPLVRPGTVSRSALIQRLAQGDSRPIVSVVAPPGYGKTIALSQWAENNGQAFAWVSVDQGDNDTKVLLTYIAEALDAVQPIGGRVFDALASPHSSVPGSVVPRLGSAFLSMTTPLVLVVDDVHLLHDSECRAALSVLADHVPAGSRMVLAGRAGPPVRVARLRAEGRILEIGPSELSFSAAEAAVLLRNAGLTLTGDEVDELHRRTEGWPAGLYLAALYLREGGSFGTAAVSFGGDDRLVSEYMESEFLAQISPQQRVFLTRTAVLEQMSGPLCEAVLEQPGSAATLAALVRSNLLLVPLDRRGQWYRYHHLFRDMLLAEMDRSEPGLMPVLRRRAAAWCLDNGRPEEALEYSIAAGDVDTAARLVQARCFPAYLQGRRATTQRWFTWLDGHGGIEAHPMMAVQAAIIFALTSRPAEAERWAGAVDRWQYGDPARPDDPATEAMAALLRAGLCRRGVEQMRADADEAALGFAAAGGVQPSSAILMKSSAALYQGIARFLCGDLAGGDAYLQDAVSMGEAGDVPETVAVALAERSLLAMARNQWDRAGALADQAGAVVRTAGIEVLVAYAAQARIALHRGDVPAAHRELLSGQRWRHMLTYAIPHQAVQARIELARVHLALADLAGARTLMREADEILAHRPGLGILVTEAKMLRAQLAQQPGLSAPGASALTAAELRLLPLLSTHLSFPEIGAEFFLSPHTIKSQAISLYRKLGASTRNQAVIRARELGMLEG